MKATFNQPEDWEPLVETLRSELQEYGGLFNLLSKQQDDIIARQPEAVLALNSEIEAQTQSVAQLRRRREELVRDLTERAQGKLPGTLRTIVPYFSDTVRPLLEALMTDINHMVRRNRQKARQNHLLLSRSIELTEKTLRVLQPENFTRTYKRSGKMAVSGRGSASTRYHAVG